MNTPTTISRERLLLMIDGRVIAHDWELALIASELMVRRARARQEDEVRERFKVDADPYQIARNLCHD